MELIEQTPQTRFQDILSKLLNDTMDQFEVMNLASRFSLPEETSFSKLKLQVQRFVLHQLVKEDSENVEHYSRLLNETESNLSLKTPGGYFCCLVGCLFSTETHRKYLQHLKTVHHSNQKLSCNFKKRCKREFSSVKLLFEHVSRCHSPNPTSNEIQQTQVDIACKCNIRTCSGKKFRNVDLLMKHVNTFHGLDDRSCIFDGCFHRFKAGSNSRHHFRLKHKNLNNLKLKTLHLVDQSQEVIDQAILPSNDDVEVNTLYDDMNLPDDDLESLSDANNDSDDDGNSGDYFQMQHADFLNNLCNFKFIPARTVTQISQDYLQNAFKSRDIREEKMRKSLQGFNIPEHQIDKIVHDTIQNDDYLQAQSDLSSEFKRDRFIHQNFKWVPPVEYVLNEEEVKNGAKPDVIHYIDVKESFKHLIEDKSLVEVLEQEREKPYKNDGVFRDLRDGSAFKENIFFKENPGAFAAHFYSDAVELTNPLGWAKGRHKIVQVFYTLAQIPRNQRSQIDRLQLCMVFKEALLKKYGFNTIYSRLVKDLKELELGIKVHFPVEKHVKMGLLAYSADNLEAHSLGGFSCCFSSYDICRMCHCLHSDLAQNIHDYDGETMKKYWTETEYDAICDSLENTTEAEEEELAENELFFDVLKDKHGLSRVVETAIEDSDDETEENCELSEMNEGQEMSMVEDDEDDETNKFGLRSRCPLNQLEAFHAIVGFPPDCMHDALEGVVAQDLYGGIKILIKKGYFTLEEYNSKLKQLSYTSYEASDKPQEVPKKAKKLSGKACSLWVHIRSFPLIVKDLIVDKSDEVLCFLIQLVEIVSRLTAEEFRSHEVDALEEKVIAFLDARKVIFSLFPDILGTAKPKHHYLVHYGQAIRMYGPPLAYWTARFESKHRVAKNTAESCKNFKNISKTVSYRQQMRMSSVYYGGMFSTTQFKVPQNASYKNDILHKSLFWDNIKQFMNDEDLVCDDITINGMKYQKGELIVDEVLDGGDSLKVGLIKLILVRGDYVFFVVKEFVAVKDDLGFYESERVTSETSFIKSTSLADSKPLLKRGTPTKFQFVLHHFISFDYK